MNRVRLITDPFDLASYSEHTCSNLIDFLQSQFEVWPKTARLYKDTISVDHDITPQTEEDISVINSYEDELFYVVVYPGDPITAIITVVATLALTAVILLFFMPRLPTMANNTESSNNSLGNRVNKPRPNGRIPDIFGTVISVPELLTVPLLFFENDLERELCYMCVGRGDHEISAVKDGDTPIEQIAGASAKFYGPNTSPNSGSPIFSVGGPINQPLMDVTRVNDVNGQVLRAPNANQVSGNEDIRFVYPDTIQRSGSVIDFTQFFTSGDQLQVQGSSFDGDPGTIQVTESARFGSGQSTVRFENIDPRTIFSPGDYMTIHRGVYIGNDENSELLYVDLSGTYLVSSVSSTAVFLSSPSSVNSDWNLVGGYPNNRTEYRVYTFTKSASATGYNLDGTYNITFVTSSTIVLSNPALINAAWNNLTNLPGNATDYMSPSLSTSGERWVGPFIVDMPSCDRVLSNIVALQGMYLVTKKGKYRPRSVTVAVEITRVNSNDVPIGSPQTFNVVIYGDGQDRSPKGSSLWSTLSSPGRCSVRARRLTPLDLDTEDTIVDEVKWRDCFGTSIITQEHFGNVTTVHSLTLATNGATSVKERKLNCRATRKVLERNLDNTFGPNLIASNNAADIICHMTLDPHIGNFTEEFLDVDQIYETIDGVGSYFGISDVQTFNYTFDQDGISYEEMVQAVAQAVFCTAYRQGSLLRLFFERKTDDSTLLFNHRNKVPGSEVRTMRFGNLNDHDGVEFDYISPVDGTKSTIYVPSNREAVKPKKMEVIGVQSESHGKLHAWRAWNKIRYQNTTTQFTALGEATQLVLSERIDVADNTRDDIFDGEIISQDGLVLEISQPFERDPVATYVIHLQLSSGKVEVLPILTGGPPDKVTLLEPPSEPLVLDSDKWARTTYQIVRNGSWNNRHFLLTEKGSYDNGTVSVQAINYDPRYYQEDENFKA